MSGHTTQLWDQLNIETPELVAIQFPVAGIGSRFLAVAADYLIQIIALVLLVLLIALFAPASAGARAPAISEKWAVAIVVLVLFLLHWGYFTLFEAFWNGQTPGKRLVGLRVIQQTGRSVGLFESMARNLMRVIDYLPAFYFAGAVTIFCTRRQQRLGDLVAGTLVVHERKVVSPAGAGATRTVTAGVFEQEPQTPAPRGSRIPADAIARLSNADLQLIDNFLARRLDLPLDSASTLAAKLAASLAAKMGIEIPAGMSNDTFLEELAAGLRDVKL
jgi:uncharacterized RDD family membrane protein YckC